MGKSENEFVAWLAARFPRTGPDLSLGIGDDMAIMHVGFECAGTQAWPPKAAAMPAHAAMPHSSQTPVENRCHMLLATADMLMDGVDFDMRIHTPQQAGRKALAASLSDCAAMAARPRWALVSVALPNAWTMPQAQGLYLGMAPLADQYACRIVGGDTNSWDGPLVIDVTVLAEPWPGVTPVPRGGARPGDWLCVTGRLGGSLAGHHLDFEPRVREARTLAVELRDRLHALMDLSDGLSTDAARLAAASNCGIAFDRAALELVVSEAARDAARRDGRTPLDHALNDGEDFELLMAVAPPAEAADDPAAYAGDRIVIRPAYPDTADDWASCEFTVIGTAVAEGGLWLLERDAASAEIRRERLPPGGWQHFKS